ncbi:MAG: hypothetical protein ACKOGA_10320, partial [Planctomycetaceae bacterium]
PVILALSPGKQGVSWQVGDGTGNCCRANWRTGDGVMSAGRVAEHQPCSPLRTASTTPQA